MSRWPQRLPAPFGGVARMSKYRARPVIECTRCGYYEQVAQKPAQCKACGGAVAVLIWHASSFEFQRWCELRQLEISGAIRDLNRQVPFDLRVNDVHICRYVADFTYHAQGALIVEDTKGVITAEARLKANLLKACHGIDIIYVRKRNRK